MKIHIFIGHHKSGSSSIQRHLAIHSQALIKQGALYPFVDLVSILCSRCAFDACIHPSKELSKLQQRINTFAASKNFFEPHNGLAFQMLKEATGAAVPPWHGGLPPNSTEMFKLLHEQLEESGAHTVVIASEVFSNFGAVGKALVARLLEGLPEGERSLHIILRRPDDYLHSWYGQELCFGYPRMGTLAQRLKNIYLNSIHVDYSLLLNEWVESHLFATMRIIDYRDLQLLGGSVPWFMQAVAMNTPDVDSDDRSTWANPSLHPSFINLVRRSNTVLPRHQAQHLISLLKKLGPADGLPPPGEVELLGKAARQLLCERFASINVYLGHLVNRPLFFLDAEVMREQRPIPLQAVEAVAASIALDRLGAQLSPRQLEVVDGWARGLGITNSR